MPVLTGVVHVYSFLELSLYMSANTHTHTRPATRIDSRDQGKGERREIGNKSYKGSENCEQ